jgi:hypothetical protein
MALKTVSYPLQLGASGPAVVNLHAGLMALHKAKELELTDAELKALDPERKEQAYGAATAVAVKAVQAKLLQPLPLPGWPHGRVDSRTASYINQRLEALGLLGGADPGGGLPGRPNARAPVTVQGVVLQPNRRPAAGIEIDVVALGFGGKVIDLSPAQQEALTTITDDRGGYAIEVPVELVERVSGKSFRPATLQIRHHGSAPAPVALSRPLTGLAGRVTVNLVTEAAVGASSSEFGRLSAALLKEGGLGSLGELANAKERPNQRDVSTLAGQTGWDARLVALAASSQQLAPQLAGLPEATRSEVAYALLRSGLPANRNELAEVPSAVVVNAVARAREAGVVGPNVVLDANAFHAFRGRARLERRLPGDKSAVREWIVGDSGVQQAFTQFLESFDARDEQGQQVDAWAAAKGAPGLDETKVRAIQDSFRLADVLGYSRGMVTELASRKEFLPKSPEDLVDAGYHDPQAWLGTGGPFHDLADPAVIESLLPPIYGGASAREKLEAYIDDVTTELRLRLPTRVIAQQLRAPREGHELPLQHTEQVATFLMAPVPGGKGEEPFSFSRMGMGAYLQQHGLKLLEQQVPDAEQRAAVVGELNRLHRAYQLVPGNAALKPLMEAGLDSANRIARLSPALAQQRLKAAGMSAADASLVVDRAHQIQAMTTGILATLRTHASFPSTTVTRNPPPAALGTGWLDSFAGTSLAQILDAPDHCACEHCESVLSPSAYFVDLLRLLDTPADENDDPKNPRAYVALTARRPDLVRIPLTCDNSHTPLPYIDLVNEILEFAVEHDGVLSAPGDALPADNAGETSEDLLVEPRNLRLGAYRKLAEPRHYPLSLPFDLPTEMAREWSRKLGRPMAVWLEVSRNAPQQVPADGSYGRSLADLERAGLGPAELPAFTEADPAQWQRHYGFDNSEQAVAELSNLKALSQRLDITYEDLSKLLGTWFVNPVLGSAHLLRRAHLGPLEARYWADPPNQALYERFGHLAAGPSDGWTDEDREQWREVVRASHLDRLQVMHILNWRARELLATGRRELINLANSGAWQGALVVTSSAGITPEAVEPCDMTTMRLARVSSTSVDEPAPMDWVRLSLFVRWWRHLGWPIHEVDTALRALMPGVDLQADGVDAAQSLHRLLPHFALRLGVAREAHALMPNLPFEQMLTIWSDVVTDGAHSQYARTFLSPTLLAIDAAFDDEAGQYLQHTPPELMRGHLGALGASLGITEEDFKAFIDQAGHRDNVALTLATLSELMRHAVLARGMGISIADLTRAIRLTGLSSFARPEAPDKLPPQHDSTLRLVVHLLKLHAMLRDAGLTWSVIESWQQPELSNQEAWGAMPWMGAGLTLDSLATALASEFKIEADAAKMLLTDAAVLPFAAGAQGSVGSVADALVAIAPRLPFSVRYLVAASEPPLATLQVARSTIPLAPAAAASASVAEMRCSVSSPVDVGLLLRVVPQAKAADVIVTFNGDVITGGEGGFKCAFKKGVVAELVVSAPLAALPLEVLIDLPSPYGRSGLERMAYAPTDMDAATRAMAMMRRAADVVRRFDLSAGGVNSLATTENASLRVNLAALVTPAAKANQVPGLERLLRFAVVRKTLRATDADLLELIAGKDEAGVETNRIQMLANMLGKEVPWIEAAARIHGVRTDAVQLGNLEVVQRFVALLGLCVVMKVDPARLAGWREIADPRKGFDERLAKARDMAETARSLELPRAWRRSAKAHFDRLRQRRRDVLVQYLLQARAKANPGQPMPTQQQLYEHLLIDPGMEPVVQTSRIRLGIASVQLFVQRVLLGFESIPASTISNELWEWMRRYRVWEANRKIFLYPENWLEPEFRNEKSHLFEELESSLLQGDFTSERAEQALLSYLQGLEQVGRVEILSTFLEQDADRRLEVLHVVGRSAGKYYYRQRRGSHWKPWIPVTTNVEGKHVAPVVWRGGVFVVWMAFRPEVVSRPKESPAGTTTDGASLSDLQKQASGTQHVRLQLQLNWCELAGGAWGEPRLGPIRYWPADGASDVQAKMQRDEDGSEPDPVGLELDDEEPTQTGSPGSTNGGGQSGSSGTDLDGNNFLFTGDFSIDWIGMRARAQGGELVVRLQVDRGEKKTAISITVPGRLAEPRIHQQNVINFGETFPEAWISGGRSHFGKGGLKLGFTGERSVVGEVEKTPLRFRSSLTLLTPDAVTKAVTLPSNLDAPPGGPTDIPPDLVERHLANEARAELTYLQAPLFYQDRAHTLFAQPIGGNVHSVADKGEGPIKFPVPPVWDVNLQLVAQVEIMAGPEALPRKIPIDTAAVNRLDKAARDWLGDSNRPIRFDGSEVAPFTKSGGAA